ncbi:MAG TPA: hypothetical protein VGX23_33975 [Actinocrinis sp.]|nr:hypothetical protein [Actinocrinis sp.]
MNEGEAPAGAPAEKAQNPAGRGGEEGGADPRLNAARSDPLGDARSETDAIAANQAYQSFQRSVTAAGPIGIVGGASISGGFHIHGGAGQSKTVAAGVVRAELLTEIDTWYVPAPADAELRSTLRERQLVVLGGPGGSGRTTTGLKLLSEFAAGNVSRFEVAAGLGELASVDLAPKHGYLCELPAGGVRHSEVELDVFAARLGESKSFCILVMPADTPVRAVGDYVREHAAPAPMAILKRRFEAAAGLPEFTGPEAAAVLAAAREDPELLALLGTMSGPADEVWLAELVLRVASGALDRAVALQAGGELLDRHIAGWLAQLPQGVDLQRHREQVETFALRLALAVFNDSPADLVCEAGERLAWELFTTANPRLAPGRTVFRPLDDGRLAASRARLREGAVTFADATVPARLLSFQDDRLAVRLLARAWIGRPNLRRPILRWLQDLSQDPRPDIWMRAALAIGLLTGWDFAYLQHEAIGAWAASESAKQRLVAATALDQAAREPAVQAAVAGLVKAWARSDVDTLKWTAAAVLGYDAGTRNVTTALRDLQRIGVWKDGELVSIASDCVAELFARGRCDEVLAATETWIGDARLDEHWLGLLTVLRIADLRVRQVPNIADLPLSGGAKAQLAQARFEDWPLMVAMAQFDRRFGALLAECVWQVLSSALAADVMRDELGEWIRAAERSSTLLTPLTRFLVLLIDDEDDQARLLDLVDVLATDPDDPLDPGIVRPIQTAVLLGRAFLNDTVEIGR